MSAYSDSENEYKKILVYMLIYRRGLYSNVWEYKQVVGSTEKGNETSSFKKGRIS